MGLDMYLNKKTYVKNWDHFEPKDKHQVIVLKGGLPVKGINVEKVKYIEEEAAYWRKANQIHNWFVENIQNGKDDCGEYYVDKEQLQELVDVCKKVIKASKLIDGKIINGQSMKDGEWVNNLEDGQVIEDPSLAQELLPTQSGFFFGGTEYDKWYLDDLQHTVDMLEPYLSEDIRGDFYYSSSW
jgi:hypothetical protein